MIYLYIILCSIILIFIAIKFLKNPNITKIESWLLNNLFLFLIIIIGIILILYLVPIIIDAKTLNEQNKLKNLRFLDLKYTITSLGAIFAFWYGYKKYEKDKELEYLNNYINNGYRINIFEQTNKLEILYNYYNKGIISKNIWLFIEKDFWINFKNTLHKYRKNNIKQINNEQDKEINKISKKIDIVKQKLKIENINKKEIENEVNFIENKLNEIEKEKIKKIENLNKEITNIFSGLINTKDKEYISYLKNNFENIYNRNNDNPIDNILKSILLHLTDILKINTIKNVQKSKPKTIIP